jgi:HD-GYP domain-containing protein (c-di-GMP phosphodiesterase class II)
MQHNLVSIEDSLMSRFKDIFENAIRFDPEAPPKRKEEKSAHVLLISESCLRSMEDIIHRWMDGASVNLIVLASHPIEKSTFPLINPALIFQILPFEIDAEFLRGVVDRTFENISLKQERKSLKENLALSYMEIRRLTKVGQYLATERDFDALIDLILQEARELIGADAGSIYVTERKRGEKPKFLRFKKSGMNLDDKEFLLPIDSNSIAGYVAMTGKPLVIDDVYALTGKEKYRFNYEYDKRNNYHSKSMLVIPMKNHRDEVIGVIQLINKKRDPEKKSLTIDEMKGDGVTPFTQKCIELVSALAGQAAVSIENNELISDIGNLFEGFVKASVTAIEQRDPTTSGHSFRVAEYTVALAEVIDRAMSGHYCSVKFTREQLREIRYASLLHDFGKVGVREKVLVKAKKLYEHELELIQWRYHFIRKKLEHDYALKKLRFLKENGEKGFPEYEMLIDVELNEKIRQIEEIRNHVGEANEPNLTDQAVQLESLEEIARQSFDFDGQSIPFLKNNELVSLTVRRGNLDQTERMEIESHVSHTYAFLSQIPWTADLLHVPEIAYAHHEKLNGTGYPIGLQEHEIPIQSKMMTISDIYDALTAPDRPYKKSIPTERAIGILEMEAKENRLDTNLLQVFVESKIFEVVQPGDFRSRNKAL